MEFPLEETLDSIAALLGAVEEVKRRTMVAVQVIPSRVRAFTGMIEKHLQAEGAMPG